MTTFLKELDFKKINKKQLIMTFLIGALLIVIAVPTDKGGEQEEGLEQEVSNKNIPDEYREKMEQQLEEILKNVEGVGEVKVMITLEASSELIVEKDKVIHAEELSEETIYEDYSQGQTPYVKQEYYPIVEGVLVIATGGGHSVVIENITEAIQALFEVDTHKIKIMKMK